MDKKQMMYTLEDVNMCEKVRKKIEEIIDELYQYTKENESNFGDLKIKIIQIHKVFLYEGATNVEMARFISESLKMKMENEIKGLPLNKASHEVK